jgi:hypothetical protein
MTEAEWDAAPIADVLLHTLDIHRARHGPEAALDEINTLMEVQGASQGFLFLPWNGNLSEPWRE